MTEIITDASVQTTPVTDEAEMAVLGAVLLSGTVALPAIVEEGVRHEDFRSLPRELIFSAMVAMHEEGRSIDRLTLADWLIRAGMLEDVGGREHIDTLASWVPNVGNLRQYAQIVIRASMWRQRRLILMAALEQVEKQEEDGYRQVVSCWKEIELRFRPLLERDLTTP